MLKKLTKGRDSREDDRRLPDARRRLFGPSSLRAQVEMPYRQITRVVGGGWEGRGLGSVDQTRKWDGWTDVNLEASASCRLLHAKASFCRPTATRGCEPPTGLMLLLHTFTVSSSGRELSWYGRIQDDNQAICCFFEGWGGLFGFFFVLCSSNQ